MWGSDANPESSGVPVSFVVMEATSFAPDPPGELLLRLLRAGTASGASWTPRPGAPSASPAPGEKWQVFCEAGLPWNWSGAVLTRVALIRRGRPGVRAVGRLTPAVSTWSHGWGRLPGFPADFTLSPSAPCPLWGSCARPRWGRALSQLHPRGCPHKLLVLAVHRGLCLLSNWFNHLFTSLRIRGSNQTEVLVACGSLWPSRRLGFGPWVSFPLSPVSL